MSMVVSLVAVIERNTALRGALFNLQVVLIT